MIEEANIRLYIKLWYLTDGVCEDEKPMVKLEPELKKRPVKRPRNEDPGIIM